MGKARRCFKPEQFHLIVPFDHAFDKVHGIEQYSLCDWLLSFSIFLWSVHQQVMDIWVVFYFWLLCIKLLGAFVAKVFSCYTSSSFEYIYRSGLLGYIDSGFNIMRKYQAFPMRLHHFNFPPSVYEGSIFFTSSPSPVIISF